MTVPGKGGRPRKWRSDADRVRAHRARQRGEEEPETFEAALADRDELALAVDRGRRLQADLAAALKSVADADSALHAERRRHLATERKLDRARTDLDGYRSADDRRAEELREMHDQLDALQAENSRLRGQVTSAAQRSQLAGSNRAARREAAKLIAAPNAEPAIGGRRSCRNGTQRNCAPSG